METPEKTNEQTKKKCFVIMPICDVDGYPKGHFNRVYDYIIVPACKQEGYEPIRADATSKSNVIIVEILRNILECDMAICDLSSRNPNVFYELGFRQAFNMKTVLMKDDQTDRPFDVSTIRSINYESSLRIDLVNKAITELTKALKETNEMSEKEPNSLLKLLSIDNPAKLPDRQELSLDSSLILQAIQDLSLDMHRSMNQKSIIDGGNARSNEVMLPNGQIAKIGDHIFDNKKNMEIGEVVGTDSNAIFLRNSKGEMELIDIIRPYANNLCVMPF
mgnify:FL=1